MMRGREHMGCNDAWASVYVMVWRKMMSSGDWLRQDLEYEKAGHNIAQNARE